MTSAAMNRRLAALESARATLGSGQAEEKRQAVSALFDVIESYLPREILKEPPYYLDTTQKAEALAERLKQNRQSAADVALIEALPRDALETCRVTAIDFLVAVGTVRSMC